MITQFMLWYLLFFEVVYPVFGTLWVKIYFLIFNWKPHMDKKAHLSIKLPKSNLPVSITVFFVLLSFLFLFYFILFYFILFYFILFYFYFLLFRATPTAFGRSQTKDPTGTTAASQCHSHSNLESKLHLWPTPQLMANAGSLTHCRRPGIHPHPHRY